MREQRPSYARMWIKAWQRGHFFAFKFYLLNDLDLMEESFLGPTHLGVLYIFIYVCVCVCVIVYRFSHGLLYFTIEDVFIG